MDAENPAYMYARRRPERSTSTESAALSCRRDDEYERQAQRRRRGARYSIQAVMGNAGLEVHARARGRDGEDGARVERDEVAIRVSQRHVAVRVELNGDGGHVGELAVVGGEVDG